MARMPILIICCEGKTEEQYFNILRRMYRLPSARIFIVGERGQHKALVDRTVAERDRICEELEIGASAVECWAVCDDDGMGFSFKELADYAEKAGVRLAFSRPQFEAYLLQHFEQSGTADVAEIFDRLSGYKQDIDGTPYDEGSKAKLEWFAEAIDRKPKIVDVAITNSNQRKRQSGKLFLTVQTLTERMREFGR